MKEPLDKGQKMRDQK